MKLNDIVETLKANGFVKRDGRKGEFVHPEVADFFLDLYYDGESDEIEIVYLRNYACFTVSQIKAFMIEHESDGINFEIRLNDIGSMIHLFCAFN